jgi:hypothetical protein
MACKQLTVVLNACYLLHAASIQGAVAAPQVISVTCTAAKPLALGRHVITLKVNYSGSHGCESKVLTARAPLHIVSLQVLPPSTALPVCKPAGQSQLILVLAQVFGYQVDGALDGSTAVEVSFAAPAVEASATSMNCTANRTGDEIEPGTSACAPCMLEAYKTVQVIRADSLSVLNVAMQ